MLEELPDQTNLGGIGALCRTWEKDWCDGLWLRSASPTGTESARTAGSPSRIPSPHPRLALLRALLLDWWLTKADFSEVLAGSTTRYARQEPMSVEIHKRLFSVDEYHQMVRTGILSEADRVELIEGEIVQMSPIGRRHAACVNRLNQLFSRRLGTAVLVSIQNPVSLSQHSQPQPDVALLRPRADFYASGHPGSDDILLVVEVAETSAQFDREVKIPLYAEAGIPEVWLVDLAAGTISVHRGPTAGGYDQVHTISSGELPSLLSLPQIRLSADEILV